MKHQITGIIDFIKSHSEVFAFILVVMAGIGIKIWKSIQDNTKLSLKWFISESFMSTVVALTGYFFFDKLLHLDKVLVYVICAWLGSMSTIFHKKVEMLVEKLFEALGSWITKKADK